MLVTWPFSVPTAKRSFSSLGLLKMYLRARMEEVRLTALARFLYLYRYEDWQLKIVYNIINRYSNENQ